MTAPEPKERPILFSSSMVRAIMEGRKTQTRRIAKKITDETCYAGIEGMGFWPVSDDGKETPIRCPYGVPGGRLWVRETVAIESGPVDGEHPPFRDGRPTKWGPHTPDVEQPWWQAHYKASDPTPSLICEHEACQGGPCTRPWRSSIHMPRWASRITLEVTGVRVERLQEITEADAKAEGCGLGKCRPCDGTGNFYRHDEDGDFLPCDDCDTSATGLTMGDSFRGGFQSAWELINGAKSWAANPFVWVIEFRRVTAPESGEQR